MIGWVIGTIAAGGVVSAISKKRERARYETERNDLTNENFYLTAENLRLLNRSYNLATENRYLRCVNKTLKLTIDNHRQLLADYDKVSKYAKKIGFYGAVHFFNFLAKYDSRFSSKAKFLRKVKYIRIEVAHNGAVYDIDEAFVRKLEECVEICHAYDRCLKNELSRSRQLR